MVLADYHVHSTFSDGKYEPEEIVKEAIRKGMAEIGFSDHSYTEKDTEWCMKKERIDEYVETILALKEKYKKQISVKLGIEQDYESGRVDPRMEYAIGSVHYLKYEDNCCSLDSLREEGMKKVIAEDYDGDPYKMTEFYFEKVANLAEVTGASIIGHFDLISIFNEDNRLFDEKNERYIAAWKNAVDKLIPYHVTFEVNLGGLARGYRSRPYPTDEIREYIKSAGGKLILSSDSHRPEHLCYNFEKYQEFL